MGQGVSNCIEIEPHGAVCTWPLRTICWKGLNACLRAKASASNCLVASCLTRRSLEVNRGLPRTLQLLVESRDERELEVSCGPEQVPTTDVQ